MENSLRRGSSPLGRILGVRRSLRRGFDPLDAPWGFRRGFREPVFLDNIRRHDLIVLRVILLCTCMLGITRRGRGRALAFAVSHSYIPVITAKEDSGSGKVIHRSGSYLICEVPKSWSSLGSSRLGRIVGHF